MKRLAFLKDDYRAQQRKFDVSDEETGNLLFHFGRLPPEYAENYQASLKGAAGSPTGPRFCIASEALAFEISRLLSLKERAQKSFLWPYEVRPEGKFIENPARYVYVPWARSPTPCEPRTITLENDVTLFRNGKPVLYDTKFSLLSFYGHSARKRSQLLKYQAAITHRLIDSAVIEIKGLVDASFCQWACGAWAGAGPLADVQLIYTLPLPSGKTFQHVLKPCRRQSKALYVTNDDHFYLDEDRTVVDGFLRAAHRDDKSLFLSLISEPQIKDPSPDLARYLACGGAKEHLELTRMELYREYIQKYHEGLWNAAKAVPELSFQRPRIVKAAALA